MVVSARQLATRALVQVLLALAAAYGVDLRVNRDSSEDAIKDAHRSVVRRVHPDKGGALADAQKLQAAKDAWDAARKGSRGRGRPSQQSSPNASRSQHGRASGSTQRPTANARQQHFRARLGQAVS